MSSDALLQAVEAGDVAAARALLEAGAHPDRGSEPPLLEAAYLGNVELVTLLLEHGANPDVTVDDITSIWTAASQNHVEVVRVLLENGASLGEVGDEPLMKAAQQGWRELLDLLVSHTDDPDWVARAEHLYARRKALESLPVCHPRVGELQSAALEEDLGAIARLLADGVPPDAQTFDGVDVYPVLRTAAINGRRHSVRALLAAGASVEGFALGDVATATESPLIAAIEHGQLPVAFELLARGGDASARKMRGAEAGWTALMLAVAPIGRFETDPKEAARLVRRLHHLGAELEEENPEGHTALLLAARRCSAEPTAALLDCGADPRHVDRQGNGPWLHAAFRSIFLTRPDDVEAAWHTESILARHPCSEGQRELLAWIEAILNGRVQQVESGLSKGFGTDWRIEDWTPLALAVKRNQPAVCYLLLKAGANPDEVEPSALIGASDEVQELFTR